MKIIIKNILVKIYHSIRIIEYYHRSLWQVYFIIITKIPGIGPNSAFQIFFKTTNNLMGPKKLVFTLLILSPYPRIIELDALFLFITLYIITIKKAINKVQRYTIFHSINNILNTCNELSTRSIYNFLINLSILIY